MLWYIFFCIINYVLLFTLEYIWNLKAFFFLHFSSKCIGKTSEWKYEVRFFESFSCVKAHPFSLYTSLQEEKLKGKPGYEHLSEPLHILIEAELPEDIIHSRLEHAVHFLESLLLPIVHSSDKKIQTSLSISVCYFKLFCSHRLFSLSLIGWINGPLQEGTAEGASSSEWYSEGRESESELEPLFESKHVSFQQQACQNRTIKMFYPRDDQKFKWHGRVLWGQEKRLLSMHWLLILSGRWQCSNVWDTSINFFFFFLSLSLFFILWTFLLASRDDQ